MQLDQLEIVVNPKHQVNWPGGGTFQPVELHVNGRDLIDIIREVELPYAEQEFDARVAAGESAEELGERGSLAGDYMHLNAAQVYLPSRNLLGEPYNHCFETEESDPNNQKSILLQCTCGVTECWFLLAKITVTEKHVTWSELSQFHRDWVYDLAPFVFDRTKYEAQLDQTR